MSMLVQDVMTMPMQGLMMIAFVVIKFLNTLHTGYEYRQKAYEQEMKMVRYCTDT